MDFRILGPLEVDAGDGPIPLGGARQRALLALLLLHANEVVSSDRLIEELWGADGSEGSGKPLQVAVSRLRRALEPNRSAGQASELLITRPPGYELRVEPGQLDLQRFQEQATKGREALAAGDASHATDTLRHALGMWRGPPLADLAYEAFSQAEVSRMEELRASVTEDHIAADLELGRHTELVGTLQELVARYPLRERLRGQLMLVLYRCGRQADALEVYREARRALTDELGIQPSRELRELQEAVLRQDATLDRHAPAENPAEPEPGTFVGRRRELAKLVGALDDALAGRGRMVLVAGEPGIGKSRLADEVVARARARRARVVVGRCWEAGGAPAYWPWVQSLRAYSRDVGSDALRSQLGDGAGHLAQLLPELSELVPGLDPPPAPESEGARFRLFEEVGSFLRRAADTDPLVIMLDDLHAADEPSLLLLRFLAREMADTRLLVVCAFRDVDPTLQQALTATLVELAREPHTARIGLEGLERDEVAEYIERSTGAQAPDELVDAIHAETDGNPLFVAEVVQLLDAEGRIAEPGTHLDIPPGVREVISRRIARLSQACRDLLVPASVLGREFGLDPLAQLSGLPRDALVDVLDEALAERVLTDVPGTRGRLRFDHALIRDTLYEALGSARQVQLHEAAAAALEETYAQDLEAHLAELAHHLFAAGADSAVDYARRAGDRAASQLAYEEAVRLYGMALTLVHSDSPRCELLLALGEAQSRAGDSASSSRSFLDAADRAEALGWEEPLARAALGYGGRMIWQVSRGDVHHVPLLERALATLGDEDSLLRVKLLARLAAGPLREAGFPSERRRAVSGEAVAMARRLGHPATLAYALAAYCMANDSPDLTPSQVDLATEFLEVALDAGDLERATEAYEIRASVSIELGDMQAAKTNLASMSALADELRQPAHVWFVAAHAALMALLEGRLTEAEELIAAARRVGERAQSWNASMTHGLQLYVLRREQGRLGEVEGLVGSAVRENPTYPIWRCVRAQMTAELGDADDATESLGALAADLPFDEGWLVSMTLLAEAAHAHGDREAASSLYGHLVPYADRIAISVAEISTGAVSRPLGLLAWTLARWDDAERHFETALATNEGIGALSWLTRTRRDYAQMLSERTGAGKEAEGS